MSACRSDGRNTLNQITSASSSFNVVFISALFHLHCHHRELMSFSHPTTSAAHPATIDILPVSTQLNPKGGN